MIYGSEKVPKLSTSIPSSLSSSLAAPATNLSAASSEPGTNLSAGLGLSTYVAPRKISCLRFSGSSYLSSPDFSHASSPSD